MVECNNATADSLAKCSEVVRKSPLVNALVVPVRSSATAIVLLRIT